MSKIFYIFNIHEKQPINVISRKLLEIHCRIKSWKILNYIICHNCLYKIITINLFKKLIKYLKNYYKFSLQNLLVENSIANIYNYFFLCNFSCMIYFQRKFKILKILYLYIFFFLLMFQFLHKIIFHHLLIKICRCEHEFKWKQFFFLFDQWNRTTYLLFHHVIFISLIISL